MLVGRTLVLTLALLTVALHVDPRPASAGERVHAVLHRVVDGDTVWVDIVTPGRGVAPREKVRLVGIDCPESGQRPWGPRDGAASGAALRRWGRARGGAPVAG
jgi:endonuclease YncB( thermonuclease family)